MLLSPVPEGLAVISTGMAKVPATSIALFPFVHLDEVMAIVEVATTTEISSSQYELLERCSQRLGLHLANLRASDHNKTLLTRSQAQAKALAEQQEKLQENNETLQQQSEELMAQTDELRAQTEELRASEEELKASEEELKAQQEELQLRNAELEQQRTELELAKKDLTEKADQLSQASTYKSEFLANMSHELRTPLNSILILSNSLAENDQQNLLPDQIESASVIHESGTSLLTLINDILDLSKIEAGKLSMHIESFPVRDLFSYLQKVFLPQADKKSIQFELVVSNNVPDAFCNDRQRMNQVLTNLLSNAIKFTNSGGVKFEVTYEGNRLSVAVTDTGIGIAEDKIDHIFGAFNQEDGSTSRKFGGTGLGLAITKKLIELMGGEIIVESNPGVGSTFTVNLPNQTSKAQPQINQYADQPKTSAPTEVVSSTLAPTSSGTSERKKGLHVLLVEDDQRLVKIFCRLIEGLGYQVTAVGTGEEALSYIAHESPEVMLLDLGLPDISGMEVLRNLRQQDSLNSIPVFIISGAADTGEAASLGAQGYLKKPITKDMLSSVLAQVESGPASITESKDNKRLLVVEDDPNAQKALQLLLAKEPITIIPETQGATAMEKLVSANPDAILLDIGLGDTDGITWLKEAKK